MSVTSTATKTWPWNTREYARFTAVSYAAGQLRIRFEDGTDVTVGVDRLLPPQAHEPDWTALRFDPYEIVVPSARGDIEVPWDVVRAETDPAFDAYLAAAAVAQRKLIGQRMRKLRDDAGLSRERLAEQSGVSTPTITRVEDGDHEVNLPLLERVLRAMGHDFHALATNPGERLVVPGYETP